MHIKHQHMRRYQVLCEVPLDRDHLSVAASPCGHFIASCKSSLAPLHFRPQ